MRATILIACIAAVLSLPTAAADDGSYVCVSKEWTHSDQPVQVVPGGVIVGHPLTGYYAIWVSPNGQGECNT